MLGAPPDPLKLSSATPVVLHASAGPPAKRVRPWAQSGPKRDDRLTVALVNSARRACASRSSIKRTLPEYCFLDARVGSFGFALCPETGSGNLVSDKRCCAICKCELSPVAARWKLLLPRMPARIRSVTGTQKRPVQKL